MLDAISSSTDVLPPDDLPSVSLFSESRWFYLHLVKKAFMGILICTELSFGCRQVYLFC